VEGRRTEIGKKTGPDPEEGTKKMLKERRILCSAHIKSELQLRKRSSSVMAKGGKGGT